MPGSQDHVASLGLGPGACAAPPVCARLPHHTNAILTTPTPPSPYQRRPNPTNARIYVICCVRGRLNMCRFCPPLQFPPIDGRPTFKRAVRAVTLRSAVAAGAVRSTVAKLSPLRGPSPGAHGRGRRRADDIPQVRGAAQSCCRCQASYRTAAARSSE